MADKKKGRKTRMTKKALMGLPEASCIIRKDKKSEPIFFARIPPKNEREEIWKKIVGEGHNAKTFTVYETYDDFLRDYHVSEPKNDIPETVRGLYFRTNVVLGITKAMGEIAGFEHKSDILFLELEKIVESTFLEIILYLKKYMGIKNDSEFESFKKYRFTVLREILGSDEEEYKLMVNNIALITDFCDKNGGHPVIKEAVELIQRKYGDKLRPVYKKYGERVLTDYGIPVH